MKYRRIIDRSIVVVFTLLSLFFSKHWFEDQFSQAPTEPYVAPGGRVNLAGGTLTFLILAICYQFLLSQDYENKTRDGIALVLIYGLINMGMIKIGMGLNGVIITVASLFILVYLNEKTRK